MIFFILPSGYCVELNSIIFKPKSKRLMMVFGALRVVYRGWECSQSNRGAILLRSRFAGFFLTFSKNIFSIESKLNFIEKSQNFHFPKNLHFWDSNAIVMVLTPPPSYSPKIEIAMGIGRTVLRAQISIHKTVWGSKSSDIAL